MVNPYHDAQGIKAKRAIIKRMSVEARPLAHSLGVTVNTVLEGLYADGRKGAEWHTARAWFAQGKKIAKGAYPWVIWGKPRNADGLRVDEPGAPQDDEYHFVSLAFVWNDSQVIAR